MGLSNVERIMARRQIAALIRANPVSLVLHRRPKIATPGNGWKWGDSTPLPAQAVMIVPFKRRMTEFLINTELGDLPDLPFVVIGYPSLDIEKDDTFTWHGDQLKVETVDPLQREVRIAAQVDYYGGTING